MEKESPGQQIADGTAVGVGAAEGIANGTAAGAGLFFVLLGLYWAEQASTGKL